jgi:ribosomal subunit interface protein
MMIPIQITFRDVPHSTALEDLVRERASKLETFSDRIVGCRVALETPHRHHHNGKQYSVRIDLTVPGDELVVSSDGEDMYAAVNEAFQDAQRRLRNHFERLRAQARHPHGT